LQLHYSAIHEAMIDTNIRRITFWYWHCRAIAGRLHGRKLWPPEEFRKAQSKPRKRELFVIRDDTAAMYDTFSKVALPDKIGKRIAAGVAEAAPWDALGSVRAPEGTPQADPGALTLEGSMAPIEPDGLYVPRHSAAADERWRS
jgi:hypothetical protein